MRFPSFITGVSSQLTARVLAAALVAFGSMGAARAQIPPAAENAETPRSPLRTTEAVTGVRRIVAYTYQEGVSLEIPLRETFRIPGAGGKAKVERRRGTTRIDVEVDGMKPATEFGGDFATFVLWTVSPEGQVENTGEFVLRGKGSRLTVTTPLQTFGMMVTAEPHFLVRRPSTLVVLENQVSEDTTLGITRPVVIEYRGYEGIYNFETDLLDRAPYARGDVRTDVSQARAAVRLAERAGAERFVPEPLERARELFYQAVDAYEGGRAQSVVTTLAQDAIRLALDTQVRAEELGFQAQLDEERAAQQRRFEEALEAERAEHADEISQREAAIRQARSETERARLEIEQRDLDLELERQAREAALRQAGQEALRADAARADSLRALQEREAALARMRDALNRVAETRVTTEGLIVNLPDILFDFGASALKPETREVLSRICGILSVTEGYRLEIEGHTDSVGSDEFNQRLSEERAASVHAYLGSCGLAGVELDSRGWGEARPIASNDTSEGRSRNRRVEILVQDVQR